MSEPERGVPTNRVERDDDSELAVGYGKFEVRHAELTQGRRLKTDHADMGYSTAEGLMLVAEEGVEIRVLRRQGKSIRETVRILDVSRNTVRRYLRKRGCHTTIQSALTIFGGSWKRALPLALSAPIESVTARAPAEEAPWPLSNPPCRNLC